MESRPSSQEASASSSSPVNLVNYTSTSKISPTGILLRQEKEEMQNLNDRLAAYIEQVRCLGQENRRLMIQVQTNDEITTIKNLYEKELSEARQLLDEKSKDIAKLHLDVNRTTQENQDLSNRLIKRVNELANVEKKVSFYKSRAIELQGKLSQALSEKKKQDDVNKELTADICALTKQLSTASEKLQAESLKRIDFENRLHTSVEKMTFKSQVFENELTESKVRKQVELNELGEQLQIQFDQKLAENLHKLRRQYENQMCVKEIEIKALYDEKISDLKLINEKLLRDAEMVRDELSQTKTRSSTFQSRIHELEVHNEALSTRVKNLEKLIDDERNDHLNCIMNREHRISELQEKNGEQLKDYQDLLDIRVALDMEIAAYDKLLEGEEERLKITPLQKSASQEGRASLTRFRTPVGPRRVKSHRDYFKNMDKISPIIKDHQSAANARLEIFRQVLSAPTVRVSGGHGGVRGEDGREQLYFQQGDPISREECAIM